MIRKSGNRFSEKIMLKRTWHHGEGRCRFRWPEYCTPRPPGL